MRSTACSADLRLQDYEIPDPELSDLGRQQCHQLRDALRNELSIAQLVELIVASPMKRTLQTAQLALGWLIDRGVPMEVRAEWQGEHLYQRDMGIT